MLHHSGDELDLRSNFEVKTTEKDVTFGSDDIWFSPTHSCGPIPFVLNGRQLDGSAYNTLMKNYYGFHLPDNKLNIDKIIVKKTFVIPFEEAKNPMVKPDADESTVDAARRMERRLHREAGGFHFPGHLSK
jgi:hypothetical protein